MSIENPMKVLLVDDVREDCATIQEMMCDPVSSNFELHWVDSYHKGIDILSSQQFDICLISYELNNKVGLEFVKYAHLNDQNLPIILLQTEVNELRRLEAQSFGASEAIVKSDLSPALLKQAIRYAIDRKEYEQKLIELSHKDSLTGIPNRSLFQIRLRDAIASTKRNNSMVAILFLDVDNFKDINNLMGYPAGDILLKEIASRLLSATRESDITSRLGGDEFAVVATNVQSERDIVTVANRLLESLIEPIMVDSFEFKASVSIGIAICPSDGTTVDMMIRSGDEALYQAKHVSRGSYHFFNKEMHERRMEAQAFEKELDSSIENNELFLQYQPVINLETQEVVGAEALVRWEHPERGIVPPDEFIGIAEKSGYINILGKWVITEACRQTREWIEKYSEDFSIAVNVSLAQLRHGDFVEVVQDTVLETGISYRNLTLEITESMIADNTTIVLEALNKLRDLGVRISVDDFGTGHSSLARLKNFPVHDLKIDRSLISHVAEDHQDAAIAKAILTLAYELKLNVIAEGIENAEQAEFMKNEGCGFAQGYHFSKPVLASEFEENFLDKKSKTA